MPVERALMVQSRNLTPTQQAIFDVLSDGRFHTRWELIACLPDSMGGIESLRAHLTGIRKVIEPRGMTIRNTIDTRRKGYVMVRFLHAD